MPSFSLRVLAAALWVCVVAVPIAAAETPVASRLSAALGGPLGEGMGDAGGVGHGRFDAGVELRPGRNDGIRKQVLASQESSRRMAAR